jgi:CheY-like chemotaxis protein
MAPTVLVADDDPDIRLVLRQVLRDEGFEVREARDGLETLEQIAEEEPDLLLLDLMMPLISGWDVLKTLRSSRSRRDVPIVVLSALPAPGAADYIQKPVSYERLVQILDVVRARVGKKPSPTPAADES